MLNWISKDDVKGAETRMQKRSLSTCVCDRSVGVILEDVEDGNGEVTSA